MVLWASLNVNKWERRQQIFHFAHLSVPSWGSRAGPRKWVSIFYFFSCFESVITVFGDSLSENWVINWIFQFLGFARKMSLLLLSEWFFFLFFGSSLREVRVEGALEKPSAILPLLDEKTDPVSCPELRTVPAESGPRKKERIFWLDFRASLTRAGISKGRDSRNCCQITNFSQRNKLEINFWALTLEN